MSTFPQGRTLAVLSATQVIGSIGYGAAISNAALLVRDISGSTAWAGLAVVMMTLGAAVLTIPLVRLAVRHGRRPALTIGWAIAAAGGILSAAGASWHSLSAVLGGLVLIGSSTAANLQSRFAATDRAQPHRIGSTLSIVVWSTTLGAVAGPNLSGPAAAFASALGIPDLSGPYVIGAVTFGAAALLTFVGLRPDPMPPHAGPGTARASTRSALAHIRGDAAIGLASVAVGNAVMVGVMALTPVHMADHGLSLHLIGITVSIHLAGMFALSPAIGAMSDRIGARNGVIVALVLLGVSTAIAGTAGHSTAQLTVGLFVLGVGWSVATITGSALLTQSVDDEVRAPVQGLCDLAMQVAGAAGGLLGGLALAHLGFAILNLLAAALVALTLALVARTARVVRSV